MSLWTNQGISWDRKEMGTTAVPMLSGDLLTVVLVECYISISFFVPSHRPGFEYTASSGSFPKKMHSHFVILSSFCDSSPLILLCFLSGLVPSLLMPSVASMMPTALFWPHHIFTFTSTVRAHSTVPTGLSWSVKVDPPTKLVTMWSLLCQLQSILLMIAFNNLLTEVGGNRIINWIISFLLKSACDWSYNGEMLWLVQFIGGLQQPANITFTHDWYGPIPGRECATVEDPRCITTVVKFFVLLCFLKDKIYTQCVLLFICLRQSHWVVLL